MAAGTPWRRPLGAVPLEEGLVEFRVWAPRASSVAVRSRGDDHELADAGDGVFEGELFVDAGDDYLYVLDERETWPDPNSRWQPDGIDGRSRVLDTGSFRIADGPGVALGDLVVYELHVGTFSAEGTFEGIVRRLGELRDLGATAIELMPIGAFPGERGWGYDGVYGSAPHRAYGGPAGFARLVDAVHREGLAVILDVVYNHIGPGSEAIGAFGPYFTDRYDTYWGDAVDYSHGAVREWAIQNAELWVRDYKVDGLRLDAAHAIYDESEPHVLAELAGRVRAVNPRTLVISEMQVGDLRPIEEWGHDAQWDDTFHHALHVLLTGERDGYYEGFGRVAQLAREYERTERERLVICAQNHDQVGNRPAGDRLPPDRHRVALAAALFAPQTPLLFMGEEYHETRPFQFFADHVEPAIAQATREGRKREFESFAAFAGEDVPDPQAEDTFLRSKLDRRPADPWVTDLVRLRRELPPEVETEIDEERRVLRVRRGGRELVLDFANVTAELLP